MATKKIDLVRAALAARGEHIVTKTSCTKYEVWTRKFMGSRREGKLVPVGDVQTFWFVSKRGYTVRYGLKSTGSKHLNDRGMETLVREGQDALALARSASAGLEALLEA